MNNQEQPHDDSYFVAPSDLLSALSEALTEGRRVIALLENGIDKLEQGLRKARSECVACSPTAEISARVPQPRSASARLTGQESKVLELLASGLSNREIAAELGLAEKTVKNYVHSLLGKLRVATRTEAAILALKSGARPRE